MSASHSVPVSDSRPSVMLTVAELRELLREEIGAVLSNDVRFASSDNGVSAQPRAHKPYRTVKEAAEFLSLAASTIRLYIRKGQLSVHRVGRRVILSRAELETFVTRNSSNVVKLFRT